METERERERESDYDRRIMGADSKQRVLKSQLTTIQPSGTDRKRT